MHFQYIELASSARTGLVSPSSSRSNQGQPRELQQTTRRLTSLATVTHFPSNAARTASEKGGTFTVACGRTDAVADGAVAFQHHQQQSSPCSQQKGTSESVLWCRLSHTVSCTTLLLKNELVKSNDVQYKENKIASC